MFDSIRPLRPDPVIGFNPSSRQAAVPASRVYPQCSPAESQSVAAIISKCGSCLNGACPDGCCTQYASQNQFFICLVPMPGVAGGGCCIRVMGDTAVEVATAEVTQAASKDASGRCVPDPSTSPNCFQTTCAVAGSGGTQIHCPAGVQVPNPPNIYVSPPKCVGDRTGNPVGAAPGTQPNQGSLAAAPGTTGGYTTGPTTANSNVTGGAATTNSSGQANSATLAPPGPGGPAAGAAASPGNTTAANGTTTAANGTSGDQGANSTSSKNACFPASSMVELDSGLHKTMAELEIGDKVRVGAFEYSAVFMFTHRLRNVTSQFIDIRTASGHNLLISPGHHVFVNNDISPARLIEVGDTVRLAVGETTVTQTRLVEKVGLYNPQTLHGNILVDGLLATTYTETISPGVAHAVLAPLRVLYSLFGFSSSLLERGVPEVPLLQAFEVPLVS
jgi:desert hedgehog